MSFLTEYENFTSTWQEFNQLTKVIIDNRKKKKSGIYKLSDSMISGPWVDFCIITLTSLSWTVDGVTAASIVLHKHLISFTSGGVGASLQ